MLRMWRRPGAGNKALVLLGTSDSTGQLPARQCAPITRPGIYGPSAWSALSLLGSSRLITAGCLVVQEPGDVDAHEELAGREGAVGRELNAAGGPVERHRLEARPRAVRVSAKRSQEVFLFHWTPRSCSSSLVHAARSRQRKSIGGTPRKLLVYP